MEKSAPGGLVDKTATAIVAAGSKTNIKVTVTPDRYETDFHLPHGHATSFAGGPLAAMRNKNPELTRYETAVRGLYLTGAATFPGAGVWGASGRNAATVVLRSN